MTNEDIKDRLHDISRSCPTNHEIELILICFKLLGLNAENEKALSFAAAFDEDDGGRCALALSSRENIMEEH